MKDPRVIDQLLVKYKNKLRQQMFEEVKKISSAYRNSRRNTSLLCGIGIAWSAAQFEINTMSLGALGGINLERASIPILIAILCIYAMTICTLEYMIQSKLVRSWPLAQVDYRINLYLVRFALVVLTAGAIARNEKMVMYIGGATLSAALGFFILSFALMFITMPARLFIRHLSGRPSVASSALEATYYSFLFSGIVYVLLIVLVGFNVINPFDYLGNNYKAFTGTQLLIFSGVILVILFSFFFDRRFLNMVFAFEPIMIERKYFENGKEIFSIEPNPNHPDYEKHKSQPPLKYRKIKPGEEIKTEPIIESPSINEQ